MRRPNDVPAGLRWRILLLAIILVGGCSAPLFRGQSPDEEDVVELADNEPKTRFVGDLAAAWNTTYLRVQGVGFVTQLNGTGSDPAPTGLRDQLVKEMQSHDVKLPTRALASDETAIVLVTGYIPPGAQKGDTFDVEVRVPPRSKTTSLSGGWLMQARLRERQVMENASLSGHLLGSAQGAILEDALFDTAQDEVLLTRGRVLGGGVVNQSRGLGLIIREEHSSIRTSSLIGAAINERFHYYQRGVKSGVANPQRDNMIELALHGRYKHNIARYLAVVSKIAVGESPADRVARLQLLERMLLEPTSAAAAALELEAYGPESLTVLKKGLRSADPEVRFYSAEALAYLDDNEAADELFAAARDERAFRWRALSALSVMDQFTAKDRLIDLMSVPSVETRYGAFRALRAKNALDPLVRGELLGKQFAFHVVPAKGEPLIHFARSRRPEVVVFGHGLRIRPPNFLFAGDDILIKGGDGQQVKVTRYRAGQDNQEVVCTNEVDEVVRAIVELGGGYAEVLQALRGAKDRDYLTCRVELDALPRPGRTYRRNEEQADDGEQEPRFHVSNPIPDMFTDRLSRSTERRPGSRFDRDVDPPEEQRTGQGIFARMTSWFTD
jgi:hypothetical protein